MLLSWSAPDARPPTEERYLVYFGTYTGPISKGIYVSRFDVRTGQLSTPELAATTRNPSFLAIHPNGRFLYAVNEIDDFGQERAGAASAFVIEVSTGHLRLLDQVSTQGAAPCHLDTDPSGRHLFVANYEGGSIAVFSIRDDGSLGAMSSFVQHRGHGPNAKRQKAPHAHQVTLDPTGNRLWAADLGLDKVLGYPFDARQGTLPATPVTAAELPPGTGPRHFDFLRDGDYMFVVGELALTVTSFHLDAGSGRATAVQTISTLPERAVASAEWTAAEIRVHPSDRFLYASTRGTDSIAVFAIEGKTGRLRRVEVVPSGGKTPRGFAIDPTGRYLLTANQESDEVRVFRIDSVTGRLTRTNTTIHVGRPVSVAFVESRP